MRPTMYKSIYLVMLLTAYILVDTSMPTLAATTDSTTTTTTTDPTTTDSTTDSTTAESTTIYSSTAASTTTDSSTAESTTPDSSTAESTTTDSSTAESTTTEPTTAESTTTDSSTTESTTTDPTTTEPTTTESTTTDSSTAESTTTDSSTAESTTTEPTTAESTTTDSSTTESTTTDSSTAESSTTDSSTAESTTTDPTTTEPTTTESTTTDSSTAESTTTDSSTAESTTTDSSTAESTTTDSSTAESTTTDPTTTEPTTTDATTTDSSTAESTTTDSSTAESTTTDSSTAESTTTDSSTAESTTTDSSTAESTTTDSSTAESTTTDSSTAESTTTDSSTAESTTTDPTTTEPTTTDATATDSSTPESTTTDSSTAESTTTDSSTAESTTTDSSTAESTTTDSSTAESTTTDYSTAESTTTDSSTAESTTTDPTTTEPTTTDATTTDSSTAESTTTDSSTAESTTTDSSTAESTTTDSSTAESTTTDSSTTESTTTDSFTAESTTTDPTTTEPTTTDATTTDSSTAESTTTVSSTAESTTTDSSTAESTTTDSSTTESTTTDSSTAESTTTDLTTTEPTTTDSTTADSTTTHSTAIDSTTTPGPTTSDPGCIIHNLTDIIQTPSNLRESGNGSFRCEFHTNSRCVDTTMKWKLKGVTIGNSSRFTIWHYDENGHFLSNLTIQGLQQIDRGMLTCQVDSIIRSKEITITERPVISISPVEEAAKIGKKTIIICNITNYSFINQTGQTFTWCHGNNALTGNINSSSTKHSVLNMDTTQLNDKETYSYSCDFGVNISCPTTHVSQIYVFKDDQTCGHEQGSIWDVTPGNYTVIKRCPDPFKGYIKRYCNPNGDWEVPDMNDCTRPVFNNTLAGLNKDMQDPKEIESTVTNAISTISNATVDDSGPQLSSGELKQTTDILNRITELVNNSVVKLETTKNFFGIIDQMLSTQNNATWRQVETTEGTEGPSGVTGLMQTVKNFGEVVANNLNDSEPIRLNTMDNIVIEIGQVNNNEIQFTANGSSDDGEAAQLNIGLSLETKYQNHTFIAVVYRTIASALPNSSNENVSEVLSLSLTGVDAINLTNPIELTFNTNENISSKCVFWNFDNSSWSTNGCNWTGNVCACYHLTDFAVLMSPLGPASSVADAYILRIISFLGCIVSSLSTLVTMAVYFKLWRYVKSDRNRLLMNLCAALTVAYLLFLGGINSTHDDALCTTIAALLHYFFLVTFCLMLAEGIEIFISVTVVFHSKSKLKWFLLLGWGVPAVVVAVTIGITHADKYHSDLYCWLSFTNGVIYSFIGPVVFIILVNIIVLVVVMKALYSSQFIQTKTEKQKVMAGVRSVTVLLPILGITWLFGIVSITDDLVVFQYLFALTNSLQGFFIFLFYCVFNVSVRQAMARKMKHFESSRTQSLRTGIENSESVMKALTSSQDDNDDQEKIATDTRLKLPRPSLKSYEEIQSFSSPQRFPSFSSPQRFPSFSTPQRFPSFSTMHNYDTSL